MYFVKYILSLKGIAKNSNEKNYYNFFSLAGAYILKFIFSRSIFILIALPPFDHSNVIP